MITESMNGQLFSNTIFKHFRTFFRTFFSGSWNSVEHSRAAFGPVRETDEEDWLEDPEGLIRIMTTDPKSLTVL